MYISTYTYIHTSAVQRDTSQSGRRSQNGEAVKKRKKFQGSRHFHAIYMHTYTHADLYTYWCTHTHIYIHTRTHTSQVQKDTSHSRRCSLTKSDIHTSGCKWLLLAFAWDFRQALDARLLTPTRSWCYAFSILSELAAGSCKLLSWLSLVLSKTLSVLRS